MIIDVNASLGPYPFRRLRHHTVEERIALMDRHGIASAVVTSLPAVFYRDAHEGNQELWEQTRAHPSRFVPVATVNPRYVGWQRDLSDAVERWRVKAVTLVPEHHGYGLLDEHGRAALARIAEYRLPLVLTQRLEDRRQRHAWDQAGDLPVDTLLQVARAYPDLKFVLANWAGLDGARLVEAGLKGRCLIDFARMQVVFRKDVPRLIEHLGPEAVAFGSHVPFDYIAASLVKLANVELLHPQHYEAIAGGNAARFLGLEG
jgi:uncharacterized protein